jgi:hypothetical protein
MKKKIIINLMIIAIVIGAVFINSSLKVSNVFGEMFYSEFRNGADGLLARGSISNLFFKRSNSDYDSMFRIPNNPHYYKYIGEDLLTGEELEIGIINSEIKLLNISFDKFMKNGCEIYLGFSYKLAEKTVVFTRISLEREEKSTDRAGRYIDTVDDREEVYAYLEENDITKEQLLQWINYAVNKKVLTPWFDNNEDSRYSRDKLGDIQYKSEIEGISNEELKACIENFDDW